MTLIRSEFYYNSGTLLKDVKMSDRDLIISRNCLEIYGKNEGEYCFLYCRDTMQSFSFESNPQIKIIGSYGFYSCTKLTRIDLSQCTKLITIKENAFCKCSSVTELLLPEGLQNIMQYAFSSMKLQSVVIPASVLMIYDNGLGNMETLTSITFKEGSKLQQLWNNAFISTRLIEFTVPESVSTIIGTFLQDVPTLKTIKVHQNNKNFEDDLHAVYSKDYTSILAFAADSTSSYVIDSRVTNINAGAFISARCTSITIPPSVATIGGYAFAHTENLKQITLPPNLIIIPDSCFLNSGITSIDIPDHVTTISRSAFSRCLALKTVLIPGSVTDIGGSAFPSSGNINFTFKGNSSIIIDSQMLMMAKDNTSISMLLSSEATSIVIPSQVKTIKKSAFVQKEKLTSITCEGSSEVESIEDYAFYQCTNLISIPHFPKLKTIGIEAFRETKLLSESSFPSTFESMDLYAFLRVSSLPSISFSSTGETLTISNYAFLGCSSLTRISFIGCTSSVSIGINSFADCTSLSMFRVISNIVSVDSGCFMNCGIRSISFDNSLTAFDSLPSMFLKGCVNIEEIIIPTNIISIGSECFSGTSIRQISIPDSVQVLSSQCFSNCKSLERVDISSSCSLLKNSPAIFEKCTSLSYISDFKSDAFVCVNSTIYDANFSNVYLHAPGCTDNYISFDRRLVNVRESAFINSIFVEIVVFVDNSVARIERLAFASCTSLKQISIPSSVNFIGESAFINCENLQCGVLYQNKSKVFVDALISSGLSKTALHACSIFSCKSHYDFPIGFSLFAVFIMM